MLKFLALPRYAFTPAMIEVAPDDAGIYGLFDGDDLIYLGKTTGGTATIKSCLLWHREGGAGRCTEKATSYTWEITFWPNPRETEILAGYVTVKGRKPRCQALDAI